MSAQIPGFYYRTDRGEGSRFGLIASIAYLESDRIYLGGKKIHFHHIPIVGFRCTSPNLQNFTQPTKLESDRIYLGGKKIHFHHIPIVGFRCTSPNLQNWKAIAFTWGEKKFTSITSPPQKRLISESQKTLVEPGLG
ncbi:hypothetical protein ACOKW7_03670 [Limnospira platensis CENA597]|uniref:hypothetical protein n=1 Tax=Limnospira platensis TaxID=118562 RepID=UPI003DA03E42